MSILRYVCWSAIFCLAIGQGFADELGREEKKFVWKDWQKAGILAALNDPDPDIRKECVQFLRANPFVEATGPLVQMLKDPDSAVKLYAAEALGNLGEHANDHVSQLMELLTDPDPNVRKSVVWILVNLRADVRDLFPQLVVLLMDPDPDVKMSSFGALMNIGAEAKDQFPQIAELLKDPNPYVRMTAADTLGSLGSNAKDQIPQLEVLLKDPDSDVRKSAVWGLVNLGAKAKDLIPHLAVLLKDPDSNVKSRAAEALGILGADAKDLIPQLVEQLKDPSSHVRKTAAEVLGSLGVDTKDLVPRLGELLKDPDPFLKESAAMALGMLGERAKDRIPQLVELLKDPDPDVRMNAAEALGKIGKYSKDQISQLEVLLKDPDSDVRMSTAKALVQLSENAEDQISQLAVLLKNPDPFVKESAAEALGKLGEHARDLIPQLVELLKDPDPFVRLTTVRELGNLSEHAKDQIYKLVVLLKDPDFDVRVTTLKVLGSLGADAKDLIPHLAELLKDPDPVVKENAVKALGELGDHAKDQIPQLAELLKDPDPVVKASAAKVLGELGEHAKNQIPQLAELLKDRNPDVTSSAAEAMGKLGFDSYEYLELIVDEITLERFRSISLIHGFIEVDGSHEELSIYARQQTKPGGQAIALRLMTNSYIQSQYRFRFCLRAYLLAGGSEENKLLIRWLGHPHTLPELSDESMPPVRMLGVFEQAWGDSASLPENNQEQARDEIATRIAMIVSAYGWGISDREMLTRLAGLLKGRPQSENVNAALNRINRTAWSFRIAVTLGVHFLFWLALICIYPYSRPVQTLFFWNKWVRRFFGLGYVGLAIKWVPFLRQKMFSPFRENLLTRRVFDDFNPTAYFPESVVKFLDRGTLRQLPLREALPRPKGTVILEGDSGLGKTQYLLQLAEQSLKTSRVLAYLPAGECGGGVIEALKSRLHGAVRDEKFLRDLLWGGGIDLCIDGMNEVDPDTRAKITEFAVNFSRGNIVIATQPLSRNEPLPNARRYLLQPLDHESRLNYLRSRYDSLHRTESIPWEQYETGCVNFLTTAQAGDQTAEEISALQIILSNPMDLTIASQLIASGKPVHVHGLMEQYYGSMADDFRDRFHVNFPLSIFSEWIHHRYCNNITRLDPDENEFVPVSLLTHLEHHKFVVSMHVPGEENGEVEGDPEVAEHYWEFRHDKIREYFLAQAFLGEENPNPEKYLSDTRFRGVYFLLADLLPIEKATSLREKLVNHAADTGDHSISDTFVRKLRARRSRKRKEE